jgi:hypothetical protein
MGRKSPLAASHLKIDWPLVGALFLNVASHPRGLRPDHRIAHRGHRAPCGLQRRPTDVRRGAPPESELAALPPEGNAELVKQLAEEI